MILDNAFSKSLDVQIETYLKHIISRIFIAIQESGLSYGEVATKSGIPKSVIHRYATGQTKKIPVDALQRIAQATGVSFDWLLGVSSGKESFNLNPHETDVINAYRDRPEMQPAVDTLLGVAGDSTCKTIKVAAYGGGVSEQKVGVSESEIKDAIQEDEEDLFTLTSDEDS